MNFYRYFNVLIIRFDESIFQPDLEVEHGQISHCSETVQFLKMSDRNRNDFLFPINDSKCSETNTGIFVTEIKLCRLDWLLLLLLLLLDWPFKLINMVKNHVWISIAKFAKLNTVHCAPLHFRAGWRATYLTSTRRWSSANRTPSPRSQRPREEMDLFCFGAPSFCVPVLTQVFVATAESFEKIKNLFDCDKKWKLRKVVRQRFE